MQHKGKVMRKLVVGNWKMNGHLAQIDEIQQIAAMAEIYGAVDAALCLPATLIYPAARLCPNLAIGGQDCDARGGGAHTGCISAGMLADVGAKLVILGHSERRAEQGESDALVRAKTAAALAAGLRPIVCVGETEEQRDAGNAEPVVLAQLSGSLPPLAEGAAAGSLCIAYEPVWAIGTGRIPSMDDVRAMHKAIRDSLIMHVGGGGAMIPILYGGSMNGDNAADLLALPNVDGGLVGGASLSAGKFAPILAAATAA